MKVFKNKKQRLVAVFLSLVFAFMLVPFTDAYANTYTPISDGVLYNFTGTCGDDNVNLKLGFHSMTNDDIVLIKIHDDTDWCTYYAISLSPFEYNVQESFTGHMASVNYTSWSASNGTKIYVASDFDAYKDGAYSYRVTLTGYGGAIVYSVNESVITKNYSGNNADFFYHVLKDKDVSGMDVEGGADSEGGIHNPIYDEDIGTLIISKSKMYEESNGEDVNDLYNLFSWKMKTNTGFSLSDNKYARTFIQVRVESKCVVYDDRRHTKLHKKFDNYGEKAILIDSHPVDNQPLKISYLTDIPNVLPKTHAETHNPVYAGYNYTLYFRVVCTDDLAVIPSDTSKWHCGGWRALDCNADILVGQSDTTENGTFDDSDNWVTDEDDGNNHIESGSDSVHDTDDAKDDFNNSTSAVDSSVNGAISTMQSLLDMIRHIPQIISTIFSFLPSWCLSIVGLAFVALVVLIIYKLVRG